MFATSCPPVGESHLIEAYLENDSMDVLDGCSFNITVTVVPSVSTYVYSVDHRNLRLICLERLSLLYII